MRAMQHGGHEPGKTTGVYNASGPSGPTVKEANQCRQRNEAMHGLEDEKPHSHVGEDGPVRILHGP